MSNPYLVWSIHLRGAAISLFCGGNVDDLLVFSPWSLKYPVEAGFRGQVDASVSKPWNYLGRRERGELIAVAGIEYRLALRATFRFWAMRAWPFVPAVISCGLPALQCPYSYAKATTGYMVPGPVVVRLFDQVQLLSCDLRRGSAFPVYPPRSRRLFPGAPRWPLLQLGPSPWL